MQFNKQKGSMAHELYISSLAALIFQEALLEADGALEIGYDYDPSSYNLFTDVRGGSHAPLLSMTRRMDGAFPGALNPRAVWEVKEYFDNKSYGSRVNDSIFETSLSGQECLLVNSFNKGHSVRHFVFLDGYYCFKRRGRALLLRYIDLFFQGLVDDIVVGTDVVDQWPGIARRIVRSDFARYEPCILRPG